MTALAHETLEAVMPKVATSPSELDEVLWQAWKAMELPEGYRAEIVEGSIEASPTGRYSHGRIANELRDRLVVFLAKSAFAALQDINVIHKRKVWIPDLFIAPANTEEHVTEDELGIDAVAVDLIVEVVSPDSESISRDRTRKRSAYAHAGIPVYVLIDDYDENGIVTVLTVPEPGKSVYRNELRAAYGTAVTIPEGPAKGFTIGIERQG
ncbi:Uma2 family endonuclease [Streptomyces sp. NBC_01207]|uniref:Uma2 family endonuclease n=1 Tax=Streptomyces sp. NBC_01207 TaxID=2903772 RepID=UPI002E115B1D|nr:Uma2 family endonuclease [Streptomyces sp. NBC_01207]